MIQKQNIRTILCGFLLALGILAYSSIYLTNIYPFTEGWGIYYVELMKRGLVPYRDFYCYLPPLNLLIDWIFWTLSFGSLFLFRAWYVLQRIAIALLLYRLLIKWFAPGHAWIACLTGMILRTAVVWDLGGDYNQTQTLFAVFLIYAVVRFLEKEPRPGETPISRYGYVSLAGMIIALMVLLKQSTGLSALLVCLVFLICYCICFKDKHFLIYCAATAAGAVIPLGICSGILAACGAFLPFLEQVFGVAGAKGGLLTILFSGWTVVFTNWNMMLLFLTGFLAVWSLVRFSKGQNSCMILLMHTLVFILAVHFFYSGSIKILSNVIFGSTTLVVLLGMLLLLFALLIWKGNAPLLTPLAAENHTGTTAVLFAAVFAIVCLNPRSVTVSLYRNTPLFSEVSTVLTYFSLYLSFVCLIVQFCHYFKYGQTLYPKAMTFLFAGGIADAYANLMNASSAIYPIGAFIPAAVMIAILFALDIKKWTRIKNLVLCILCVLICGVFMTQKYTTAYSWWGSEVTYSMNERTEAVDIDALKGFRLAPQRKLEFEEVTKIIEANGDESTTVWGFPHIKIFNILTDHYNGDDPVPVLFYDVCSDEAAIKEAQWLRDNHPSFVIWCDMPTCVSVHEDVFRNGNPLGQREIIEWFLEVKDTDYTKVGQVGNLFVYQLNELPRNYTYFQDPNAINITAGEQ